MTTIPALTISISSLTSSTAPGDTVNYTLTIADTGQTTYAGATVTDSLADVLDDATSKGGAVATSGAVSFAAPDLTWTGVGQRRSRLGGTRRNGRRQSRHRPGDRWAGRRGRVDRHGLRDRLHLPMSAA
jgi:uncharacterized repeat protein (TIGR01451 family)